MNVVVIGTGYVGLVAGACFAETGNRVTCADIDAAKIDGLNAGRIPIYEPGLEPLVHTNVKAGRLTFTTDVGAAVADADVAFIAVGTPPDEDGSADLKHVLAVARTIGDHMSEDLVVVTKSTVPVGTAAKVKAEIAGRTVKAFHMASNPEFLKEGAAIDDFMKPDRVVVGVESTVSRDRLESLYAPFVRSGKPLIFMDIPSAELTKYAANSMLATRISFMNQIANLCEITGANVDLVRTGIGSDSRIGSDFLYAGPGYGGSCFPKDVKALMRTARELGLTFDVLEAVDSVNQLQQQRPYEKMARAFQERGGLKGRRIAMWGLAFKAETDDMRESPAVVTAKALVAAGASVVAFDPHAMVEAHRYFADGEIEYAKDEYSALDGADGLAILTEWKQFRNPDFAVMKAAMRSPIIVDARNLYDPERVLRSGFEYHSIGRASVGPAGIR